MAPLIGLIALIIISVSAGTARRLIGKVSPFISVSPPGTQRAGIVHEDTVWICIHGTNSTDLDIIEKEFIAPSNNDALLLKELRRLKG